MAAFVPPETSVKTREQLSKSNLRGTLHWRNFRQDWLKFVFGIFLPLILFIIFIGYPMLNTIYLSLFDWNGITTTMKFIGFQNYIKLIHDSHLALSLTNNLLWFVLTLIFPLMGGLILGAILSSGRIYFTKVLMVLLLLPITFSMVTIGTMFGLITNPVFGALNQALASIGLGFIHPDWLGPNLAIYTLIAVSSWSGLGMTTLMFNAAMGQVPDELYETAKMEGARPYQTFWYVTLPSIRPIIGIVTVLVAIGSLRAFDLVFVMTRGGPFRRTTVLGYMLFDEAFTKYHFGYGAAIGTVILLFAAVLMYFYIRQNVLTANN
jgi:raffinose/stachyose/melibiose transport system permease protein